MKPSMPPSSMGNHFSKFRSSILVSEKTTNIHLEVVGLCSVRLNIIEPCIFKMCQELPLLKKLPTIQLAIGIESSLTQNDQSRWLATTKLQLLAISQTLLHPGSVNMEPKNGGLEDDFPFHLGDVLGSRGV